MVFAHTLPVTRTPGHMFVGARGMQHGLRIFGVPAFKLLAFIPNKQSC
jgi:hypothetical protein